MQAHGYRVALHFLWLPDSSLALSRVANRVAQGGHFIPDDVVMRRYHAGLRHFVNLYQGCVDDWLLYNAAPPKPVRIAEFVSGQLSIHDNTIYNQVLEAAQVEAK